MRTDARVYHVISFGLVLSDLITERYATMAVNDLEDTVMLQLERNEKLIPHVAIACIAYLDSSPEHPESVNEFSKTELSDRFEIFFNKILYILYSSFYLL